METPHPRPLRTPLQEVQRYFHQVRHLDVSKSKARKSVGRSEQWQRDRDRDLKQCLDWMKEESPSKEQVVAVFGRCLPPSLLSELTELSPRSVSKIRAAGTNYGSVAATLGHDPKVPRAHTRDELSDVARDCLDDFERFRARYLGSVSTPWQVEAAQRLAVLLDSPDKEYVVVNCPQGGGKTRLFSHDIPAWITTRRRNVRSIFGSMAQNVSAALCENLRDTFERTSPAEGRAEDIARGLARNAEATLVQDFGPYRSLGTWRRDKFVVAQERAVSVEKEPTWAAFSREAKFLGWRVDLAVWDDLVNTDMLRNSDRVEDLYTWWDNEAASRLDPGGLLVLVGQRLGSNDIYRYCLDKMDQVDEFDMEEDAAMRPRYQHISYKAHYEELCTGDHANHRVDAEPYPEGCMLDPARIRWRDILEKQSDGTYEVVFQQEDVNPTRVLVPKVHVDGGVLNGVTYGGAWDNERSIGQLPPMREGTFMTRYLTVDPSPTKWWACMDWLYVLPEDVEPTAGYRYLIDIRRDKMQAPDLLELREDYQSYTGLAEEWVQRSKIQGVPITHLIMEKNAAQRFVMQYRFFVDWAQTRGVQIIQHETESNKADPDFGVWATIPTAFRHGRVRLPGEELTRSRIACNPLVSEVTTYPKARTDDCVMSMWFGEYNLQHLVHQRRRMGNINRDMPRWARKLEVAGGRR